MVNLQLLNEETREGYYPTPDHLAEKMAMLLQENLCNDHEYISEIDILEPSAGDGQIVRALGKCLDGTSRNISLHIDCIEMDPNLRVILKERFNADRKMELRLELDAIERKQRKWDSESFAYIYDTEEDKQRHDYLESEYIIQDKIEELFCVGDDFLSFSTYKKYTAIVMNPPFANGDKHLLKALEMQKKTGGYVVALINAETLKNPYTALRRKLAGELATAGASIEYIKDAFQYADRKTAVEIALVFCRYEKPEKDDRIEDLLDKMVKSKKIEQEKRQEQLIRTEGMTFIDTLIEQYNNEIALVLSINDMMNTARPQMLDSAMLVSLKVGNSAFEINSYLKKVREKYWETLFKDPRFMGMLTSNLQQSFYSLLKDMNNYDFSYFNIEQLKRKMGQEMQRGYYDTILDLFDTLSCKHSWRDTPEETNIHYFSGWKTNLAWKINTKKCILPCYSYSNWDNTFNARRAYEMLGDIEKTLNYLDNGETSELMWTMDTILNHYDRTAGQVKKVEFKYFYVTFYKKGTCHISWKNERLIEKLNIFGSQKKGWLPPVYGKTHYDSMSEEERAVIDAFQGKDAYEKVLTEKGYFLMEDTCSILQLTTAG